MCLETIKIIWNWKEKRKGLSFYGSLQLSWADPEGCTTYPEGWLDCGHCSAVDSGAPCSRRSTSHSSWGCRRNRSPWCTGWELDSDWSPGPLLLIRHVRRREGLESYGYDRDLEHRTKLIKEIVAEGRIWLHHYSNKIIKVPGTSCVHD